jgi:hypothetical protein
MKTTTGLCLTSLVDGLGGDWAGLRCRPNAPCSPAANPKEHGGRVAHASSLRSPRSARRAISVPSRCRRTQVGRDDRSRTPRPRLIAHRRTRPHWWRSAASESPTRRGRPGETTPTSLRCRRLSVDRDGSDAPCRQEVDKARIVAQCFGIVEVLPASGGAGHQKRPQRRGRAPRSARQSFRACPRSRRCRSCGDRSLVLLLFTGRMATRRGRAGARRWPGWCAGKSVRTVDSATRSATDINTVETPAIYRNVWSIHNPSGEHAYEAAGVVVSSRCGKSSMRSSFWASTRSRAWWLSASWR